MFSDFVVNWINQQLDKSRLTDTSRVLCSRDSYGQYVDVDYKYISETDMAEDSNIFLKRAIRTQNIVSSLHCSLSSWKEGCPVS